MYRRVAALLAMALCLSGLTAFGAAAEEPAQAALGSADDTVVVAVVDGSFSPYHWNFLGSKMPQHQDADLGNDLPLDQAPHTWVSGFPAADSFASYQELPVTLAEEDPDARTANLLADDVDQWDSVKQSTGSAVHYRWIPGSKFIGVVDFAGNKWRQSETTSTAMNSAHGGGTSAVSVGNIHGTCPECVVVGVTYGGSDPEAASNWAMSQPWIDVVTNSFGFSAVRRDRLYSGSDVNLQKAATQRGQHIFFSSGNGQNNDFLVPNTTYFSSQEGPDWITTVGATSPTGGQYTGAGKAADLASIGSSYPSIGGRTVTSTGTFGGTSNATPVVAGMYARALLWARDRLDGPSRAQQDGVIARGTPVPCGAARAECELADGVLTQSELRTRLYEGALRTPQGPNPGGYGDAPTSTDEYELLAEGHGTYRARLKADGTWEAEQTRITGPLDGSAPATARPAGERDWMVVDSYCRQQVWGTWGGGYWAGGALPGPSPSYPLRTAMAATCSQWFAPL